MRAPGTSGTSSSCARRRLISWRPRMLVTCGAISRSNVPGIEGVELRRARGPGPYGGVARASLRAGPTPRTTRPRPSRAIRCAGSVLVRARDVHLAAAHDVEAIRSPALAHDVARRRPGLLVRCVRKRTDRLHVERSQQGHAPQEPDALGERGRARAPRLLLLCESLPSARSTARGPRSTAGRGG